MNNTALQIKDTVRTIYLAGRIGMMDWRHTLVQGLRDDEWQWKDSSNFPILQKSIYAKYDYTGPYWPYLPSAPEHHTISGLYFAGYMLGKMSEEQYLNICKEAIERSDLIACYFDREDNRITFSQLL